MNGGPKPQIQPWQVWWVELDPVTGHEQAGRRPAVVVSSPLQLGLTNRSLITVLPLTTRERPSWLHRVRLPHPGNGPDSFAITEQIRTVSRGRFRSILWTLPPDQIATVRRALARMIDL